MSKSINKLTTMLSEVLSSTLEQNDIESVMEAWNERKSDVAKIFDSAASGGRVKRRKDPNAPKKWKTGYILFCVDQREKLKSENQGLSATQITSRLGALWKNLSDKEKEKYEVLSKKDKDRYESDMSSYNPPESSGPAESGRKSRAKQERTGPKRPLSSYMYFCQDRRESIKAVNPNMSAKEITSELGRVWKELSDEAKTPYEAQASADKVRFQSEKAGDSGSAKASKTPAKASSTSATKAASSTPAAKASSGSKASKPEQAKAAPEKSGKKTAATPSKPVKDSSKKQSGSFKKTPGFECFSEEQTEDIQTEYPDWNTRKVAAELQKRWQELSPDDREAYEMEAGDNLESEDE
jgi:HMG (high mobility group) box